MSAPSPSRSASRLDRLVQQVANSPVWHSRAFSVLLALGALLFFLLAVVTPLELVEQFWFSAICFGLALIVRRYRGRLITLVMMGLSVTATSRYLYWRLTSTLGFENTLDFVFGYGLLAAELYAIMVLFLGYIQTAWPLERKPVPLPADPRDWPTIDVFIPTYNEPLQVVQQTVFTATGMDWPRDKLKVWVLDDGRRPEFREFCESVGVGYLTRPDNQHAKAGNLNAALARTSGEFVAIFDCDHIPTRSFLQVTLGWFFRDPKLAMLQTPHVFFSPDPFEKNLATFRVVPNEGELFYGLVQDGNDLWNATFFCGSCALMRRSMLEEVGGVATETVTEDAHTALKLNRLGYNTAYLALPQAAGLATESLSGHVGQRIRWARGMAQICRIDNPLFGPGLSLAQRLCYLNAMMHFFYGLPRLVFLTAPLASLFFDAHVFQSTALMIAAYALPHILHSSVTNSRVQGQFRHSFWNEVYETVLAWYIMRPTLIAFINPRLGKFNVTAKGGLVNENYFDWAMARPYLVFFVLNAAGLIFGILKLMQPEVDEDIFFTLVINMAWTTYNLVIICASIAVAAEVRQIRADPRVAARLRATVILPNGRTIACLTNDFSRHGLGLQLPLDVDIPLHEPIQVSLFRDTEAATFPAKVVFSQGRRLGILFQELDLQQQSELARLTFARADIWANQWGMAVRDTPLRSLHEVGTIGLRGFRLVFVYGYDLFRITLGLGATKARKPKDVPPEALHGKG